MNAEATVIGEDAGQISAYFSLEFPTDGTQPQWTFYLQRLSISLGRATSHRSGSPSGAGDDDDAEAPDIDLGPLKTVSRLHARIEYEEGPEHFVLAVIGRNGAWVDGVWAGPGRRVPLGPRTQIQIATRKFHFVLPPPPQEEDVDVVSEHSSPRAASSPLSALADEDEDAEDLELVEDEEAGQPEVDGDETDEEEPEPEPEPERGRGLRKPKPKAEPVQHVSSKAKGKTATKTSKAPKVKPKPSKAPPAPKEKVAPKEKAAPKEKVKAKSRGKVLPPGEEMPPKPAMTYANLCYLAIKGLGGRASLQEICGWAMDNYDWYAYNEGQGWENSVRHNLSSHRAFLKIAREDHERGKGAFWSIDPACEEMFDYKTIVADAARSSQPIPSSSTSHPLGHAGPHQPPMAVPYYPHIHPSLQPPYQSHPHVIPPYPHTPVVPGAIQPQRPKKSKKSNAPLEPAMSRAPLIRAPKPATVATPIPDPLTTPTQTNGLATSTHAGPLPSVGQAIPTATNSPATALPPPDIRNQPVPHPPRLNGAPPLGDSQATSSAAPTGSTAPLPPSVFIPIIVAPLPASYLAANPPPPAASSTTTTGKDGKQGLAGPSLLASPPIVLHESTLILSPTVFSHLTKEQLEDIQKLGVQKALQVLKGYMKVFLKEKIREGKSEKAKKKRKLEAVDGPVSTAADRRGTPPVPDANPDASSDMVPSTS